MALLGLIVLALVFSQPIWTVAKVVAGIVLSLLLPGFFLTLTLFPEATTWDDLGREGGSNGKFIDPVEKIVFVSRTEAFARLSAQLGKEKDILNDLGPDFLPPSIEVYPLKNLTDLTKISQFSDFLLTLPHAGKVQSGSDWLRRFGYFTNLLRIVVLLSGSLLIISMTFIVSYTLRLTVLSRQGELEILRLLGATSAYIRLPLLLEGMLQGLLGSSLGLGALYILYQWIASRFSGPGFLKLFDFAFFPPELTGTILLAGIVLCTVGSLFSIRRFIRI